MRNLPLSQRLALMFAAICLLTLSSIGFFLYSSLAKELAWRDDQTLLGRLERMEALLNSTESVSELQDQPQLYANMLGNTDNVLWVISQQGNTLIEINPPGLPVPSPAQPGLVRFYTGETPLRYRAATATIRIADQELTLVAGRTLSERDRMLASYQWTLCWAIALGTAIVALLGWLISYRALGPVKQMSDTIARIRSNTLNMRLQVADHAPEIRQLQARLNAMIDRLESGFDQLARFSEDLAHEMRTPLNNLIGHTQQCLSKPRSNEEYQALLLSNLEEHERLARVINSMLFLARTEQSEITPDQQAFAIQPVVDQLIGYFSGVAEEASTTLTNKTEGTLVASSELVQRALANLLDNALRYGESGGSVEIRSHKEDSSIHLTVFNTGDPVADDDLPRLFHRFYRCDPARQTMAESGGLGLAIVYAIMKHHGGHATVRNVHGGVEAELIFPVLPQ
ncbi:MULTISPECIES: heavy metal sensor histidine kinase [Marinobacter]|uniref:Sensor protein n=1 Tax=Marinobacter alkaliphilus TaxID=254719 RepID=A0ABZ3E2Z8_9GAMM|nr:MULTISPECIES: heavy metal sensor histidine kinase [unclassified Marinobacter]QFS88343.1 Sensor protein CzcS precursor [Marinobacter sp. THAF197a]QFT52128.1 Sensor protein CzcS precursor [Marinobacter sp. THAF39]